MVDKLTAAPDEQPSKVDTITPVQMHFHANSEHVISGELTGTVQQVTPS